MALTLTLVVGLRPGGGVQAFVGKMQQEMARGTGRTRKGKRRGYTYMSADKSSTVILATSIKFYLDLRASKSAKGANNKAIKADREFAFRNQKNTLPPKYRTYHQRNWGNYTFPATLDFSINEVSMGLRGPFFYYGFCAICPEFPSLYFPNA